MGLDFYSGQLVRYYTQDWETIVQKYARENSIQVQVVRQNESEVPSRETATEIVQEWQLQLRSQLNVELWDETGLLPYETDKPDWDSYGAVILWTINSKELFKTDKFQKNWEGSSLFKKFLAQKSKYSEFRHLLPDVQFWLPIDISSPIQWVDPGQNQTEIGSTYQLQATLELLNERTWKAEQQEIESWRMRLSPDETSLSRKAMFGFSIIYHLVRHSNQYKVPLKMDY